MKNDFTYEAGLPSPEKESRLVENRKFRFDYVWHEYKLAVEIHGGVFVKGRHTRAIGFTTDREKMNEAQLAGYVVIEATSEQVNNGKAIEWVKRAIKKAP